MSIGAKSSVPRRRGRFLGSSALGVALALIGGLFSATQGHTAEAGAASPAVTPVFQIGTPNQSATEFAGSPRGWSTYAAKFPNDVTYTVGKSTPAADWSFIQPGPTDNWAGSKPHTFTIDYTLTADQAAGGKLLQLAATDTYTTRPTLRITSNGTVVDTVTLPAGGGGGAVGRGELNSADTALNMPSQTGFLIPASALTAGDNTLQITTTAGAWVVYDAVTMLPAPATLGPVQVLSLNPTVFLKKDAQGAEGHLVDVGVNNTSGAAGQVTFTGTLGSSTETTSLSVPAGRSTQRIMVPPAPPGAPSEVDITASLNGQSGTYALNLPYQRRWQVDLLNGTHLDNGYHYDQSVTRQVEDDHLDQAVDQCKKTADPANGYTDGEKYRWVSEGSWLVNNYLQDRSAGQVAALEACIRSGQIDVAGAYNNNYQDLASTEQLIRSVEKGTRDMAGQFGVPITTAMQDDVKGVSAQDIQILARSGVKLLMNGTNPAHTGAAVNVASNEGQDAPALVNWQAPDGSKVLYFYGQFGYYHAYHAVNGLLCTAALMEMCGRNSPPLPFTPASQPADLTPIVNSMTSVLGSLLPGLQVGQYPQSVYPMAAFWDSLGPMNGISDVLRQFDSQGYDYPKLVMSTTSRFYADATTPQGGTSVSGYTPDPTSKSVNQLPIVTGDYTGWWADGAGSSPVETGNNAVAQARTTDAETLGSLAALNTLDPTNSCMVDAAYQQENMFTEHTWNASNEPYPSVVQWPQKKLYSDRAVQDSTNAMTSATTELAQQIANPSAHPAISVFNSLSWARTAMVTATVPSGWAGQLLDATTDSDVPYQAVDSTHIQFLAANVPAVGYAVYRLLPGNDDAGAPDPSLSWDPTTGVLQNKYYTVTISPSGTITSVVNRVTGRELVDSTSSFKLNQYVYRPNNGRIGGQIQGGSPTSAAKQWSPASATLSVKSSGKLGITIAVTYPNTPGGKDTAGKATGVESAGATITLLANTPRVDIADSLDKTKVTSPEEGYFAFPFKVDNPTVTYEGTGTPVQLGKGQFPGSSMDWQSMHSYADASNSTGGVTLNSTDAPLVEFGDIKTMRLTQRPGMIDGPPVTDTDLSSVLATNGSMFSYAFNNLWTTNFNLAYPGPMSFHYAITDHTGDFNAVNATQYGWDLQSPLTSQPLPAKQLSGTYKEPSQSLASLDDPNVVLQTIRQASPTDDSADFPMTMRLLEVAGKSGTVHLNVPFKVGSAKLLDLNDKPDSHPALTVTDWGTGSQITVPYTGHQIVSVGIQPAAYKRSAPIVCMSEFSLAPAGYNNYQTAFPNDVNYTAKQTASGTPDATYPASSTPYVSYTGTGIAAPQWSYIQPGPNDTWGGSKQHTFTLNFDLPKAPDKDQTLTVWLLDTSNTDPPTLDVSLNHKTAQQRQLSAGGGDGYRWGDGNDTDGTYKIAPQKVDFTLPASQLVAGHNTVSLTTVTGSWLAYDGLAVG
ncbi:polysaccharide lyase family protein [Streptomyces sp. NPDC020917]|uniref:polysaccharide lyase family protein n=1 Tax=Streptomyces sp. NPDC020917 TaxID=3365102 RepID=UPI003798763F